VEAIEDSSAFFELAPVDSRITDAAPQLVDARCSGRVWPGRTFNFGFEP